MKTQLSMLVLVFLSRCAVAQVNPVNQGLSDGVRAGAAILDGRARVAEGERARVDIELLKLQLEMLRKGQQPEAEKPKMDAKSVMWAWIRMQNRIPDIHLYRAEIERLMKFFDNPNGASVDHYLEGFYLMAKFASFSTSPIAQRPPAAAASSGR